MFCLPLMRGVILLAFTVPLSWRPDQWHFGWTGLACKDGVPKFFALHIKFSGGGRGRNGTATLPCQGPDPPFKILYTWARWGRASLALT